MSLRGILTTALAVLVGISLVSSALLVVVTTSMHGAVVELGLAVESIRVAEDLQINLLLHDRARDPVVRRNLRSSLRELLTAAEKYVSSEQEAQLLEDVKAGVDAYLEQSTEARLETAVAAVNRYTRLNSTQARAADERSAWLDRFANGFGLAIALLLLAVAAAIGIIVERSVLRPITAFNDFLRGYGSGQLQARAPKGGPREIREAASNFNELADSLAHQREQQLAFLAGVAHDLRNPLSALRNATSLWSPERPTPSAERAKSTMQLVSRQVDRLDRMVGDLLDAARIESGQLELQVGLTDLRELARSSVELFQQAAPGRRLELSVPDEPVQVRCDPFRIEQVLNNLLSNAIKYSRSGSRVSVALASSKEEAVLSVSDEGIGISAEDLERLFQPFHRVGSARESVRGAGLGLFVARRIVEAHGGRIELESEVGAGSTFRVLLPKGERT